MATTQFSFTVLIGLLCVSAFSAAKERAPKVQVYSRMPGEVGKANTFICHVSSFYPPEIEIELLRNNEVIPSTKQTDLTFEENWHYHLTKHVPFIPGKGERFECRVTHLGRSKLYLWEPDF